jgi:CubicO group peptidase (beta-lactamase class C family)
MLCGLITRARVPRDVRSVTSVRPGAEIDPRDVGVAPYAVERIWSAAESLYRSGIHPALALCVRHQGRVLIDRTLGHVYGNGPDDPPAAPKRIATPDTPFGLLSATKAVTAMIIHHLDQENSIRLDDPVCEYLPGFAVRGKQWITVRHVLSHRAGLPSPPPDSMNLELLDDQGTRILDLLCAMPLAWRPGRQLAYHAVTGGFILGEIVRVVTGKSIREYHDQHIRAPLGFRWMRYGVEDEDLDEIAVNYFTGFPALPPVSTILERALGVDFYSAATMSNDPRFLRAIVPSASMVATADEVSRFYQLLLNGGELDGVRIFDRRTVRRAVSEQSYLEFDFALGLPLRYGMGFMLGGKYLSFYGPDTRYAFGHIGFTNVLGWADPERQVAAALLTSGKPLFHPALYYAFDLLRQIGLACPKITSGAI